MPPLGRPSADPQEEALIARLAEAVAAGYVARTPALPAGVAGVLLSVYWDGSTADHWVAPGFTVLEGGEWEPSGPEVPWPDVLGDPALREPGEALLALVEERNAYDLVAVYYRALAGRLSAAWGVRVVAEDPDGGITDQQAPAPRGAATPPPAPPAGVLVAIPRGDGVVAGIRADGDRRVVSTDLASRHRWSAIGDGVAVDGGRDVTAVGGVLPEGAAGARVQDLFDAWHDASVGHGLWAALLPHPARGGTPPVVFLDVEGAPLAGPAPEEARDEEEGWITVSLDDDEALDGEDDEDDEPFGDDDEDDDDHDAWTAKLLRDARVPPYWDDALGRAEVRGGGSGGVDLQAGTTSVTTSSGGNWTPSDLERDARDRLEMRLWFGPGGRRAAARAAVAAVPRALPCAVDDRPGTFLLVEGGGVWVAVWADRRRRMTLRAEGEGAPPARLDLRRWAPAPGAA